MNHSFPTYFIDERKRHSEVIERILFANAPPPAYCQKNYLVQTPKKNKHRISIHAEINYFPC